jgi:hypothetical protein
MLKYSATDSKHGNKNDLMSFIKELFVFPFVAVVMGIATILVVLLIFPVWLFKEQNPHIN